MRRGALVVAAALALAGCVTMEPPPNPRGSVAPGQRLVVLTFQAPGPWIVADPDSKAETAIKFLPLGTFLQTMQEDRINDLSKEIQPYLPRPRYAQALEAAFIAELKRLHDGPVQTAAEAGIAATQLRDWNKAADQLEWRRRYFAPPSDGAAPRDYSKLLSLDDAVIVDVNLQFGLEPDEEERTIPTLRTAARVYRAGTVRMLHSREDLYTDKTSCMTLTEFRATPSDLTDRLYAMAEPLGRAAASSLARDLTLRPAPVPVQTIPLEPAPGLVPLPPAAPGGDGPAATLPGQLAPAPEGAAPPPPAEQAPPATAAPPASTPPTAAPASTNSDGPPAPLPGEPPR